MPVGHCPTAGGERRRQNVYLCNRFTHSVRPRHRRPARIGRDRPGAQPVAMALTPDGALLVVANHLPAMLATADHVAAAVSLIDTGSRRVASVLLPHGSTSVRDVPLARRQVCLRHAHAGTLPVADDSAGARLDEYQRRSVLDLTARRLVTAVVLDSVSEGHEPVGHRLQCGRQAVVGRPRRHARGERDRPRRPAPRLDAIARGKATTYPATLDEVSTDLTFLAWPAAAVARFRAPARGRWRLSAAVLSPASSSRIDLAVLGPDKSGRFVPVAAAGRRPAATAERRGERSSTMPRLCFQRWLAPRHPDSRGSPHLGPVHDGIGNPHNTQHGLHAHRVTPVMSLGRRGSAEIAVRAGLRHILMTVQPEEVADDLDAYLKALTPVPSPRLVGGQLSPAAERGKVVFAKTGCVACHAGPLCTDGRPHEVGTGTGVDRGRAFVTPRLTEVWRTAPYLHDGSAATVDEAFSRCGGKAAAGLPKPERADLIEYLLSL
ncbi:MAG: hypothetical protein U0736_17790 [Gemmataceae bacterium]